MLTSGISFTSMIYSSGERHDPCGVPAFIVISSETALPTLTLSFLSLKKELISRTKRFGMLSLSTLYLIYPDYKLPSSEENLT